ncbi:mediator complex subunit 13 C-terminal-domain-containing protein [Aspergillus karnatakaensis]|uniref:uncharacterized protein n=1 Tax=Aspergillus karnatakaensis TaxID=1810916 RepID=UPI003CCDF043
MEFPGGSITNIRVIDGFSNIYWRIYTQEAAGTSALNDEAALKRISRLKEIEVRLRCQGCLVLVYPRKLGLLMFSATADFEHLAPWFPSERKDDSSMLLFGNLALKAWTSGSVSSRDLTKSLRPDTQAPAASSPAGPQPAQQRRADTSGGSAAIYASFISAVTTASSLQLVQQNNAIPLGPKTLFTTVETDSDEGQGVVSNSITSVSTLTSLHVQLTSVGKLTVSLQTIAQNGLLRLCQPGASPSTFSHISPGTDLWLAPSGSITRLLNTRPNRIDPSRSFSASDATGPWKSNVLEWLRRYGLPVDIVNEENWVEVEVWDYFYAKLSGELDRAQEEHTPLPMKRILWPAVYCFRRSRPDLPDETEGLDETMPFNCDPLDFAEIWSSKEIPKAVETKVMSPPDTQEKQASNVDTLSPGPAGFPEGIESLSRVSQYPDLNSVSLVYPTPPDGTTGIGANSAAPLDVFAEDSELGSLVQTHLKPKHNSQSIIKIGSDSDANMGFGPTSGLGVGSGLYDTNEDDDLFGDIHEKDFGAKGITDADFSFFDDHDFDHTAPGSNVEDIQESLESVDTSKLNAVAELSEADAPSPNEPMKEEDYIPSESPQFTIEAPQEQPATDTNAVVSSPHHSQVQTISPPLSPVEVKKILFPDSSTSDQPLANNNHPNYYSPVDFKNSKSWDRKYSNDGKFSFTGAGTDPEGSNTAASGIPTIGLPRRKSNVKVLAYPRAAGAHGTIASEMAQDVSSSPDSSSDTDDESGDSGLENNILPANSATLKRKRARSSPRDSPALALEKGSVSLEQESSTLGFRDSDFLGNFLSTFSDWSVTGLFSLPENQIFPSLALRNVQVQVAQLLIDQVTQSSLDHRLGRKLSVSCLDNQALSLQELFEGSEFLGGSEKLDLTSFVSLQEQNLLSPDPSSATTPRQNPQRNEFGKGSISKLPPPHLRVRRGKDYLEILPPAVSFWEAFGLEPVHGPKDVTAYCIHPHVTTRAADAFLERLGLLYTSCNLGRHSRGDDSDEFNKGLRDWNIQSSKQSDYHTAMQHLKQICEELATVLLSGAQSGDNIVVYIINPFSHAASLFDICAAFWSLLQRYIASADNKQPKQLDQVLLQIMPMNFVASVESLVVPPQTEYLNLALEIYSRCSPRQPQPNLVNGAPPMTLIEPLPPSIGFRLASERSSPLQEGKCLHVAYSRSQDQRWLSAAWSDNSGVLQQTISYCLRFRNSTVSRPVATVRNEIWAATKDIMDKSQARWRVIIVSTDNVDQNEHEMWLSLADQYNKSRSIAVEVVILSANTISDLCLSPPLSQSPINVLSHQTASTPVATPLPSGAILSPEQPVNASTPPSAACASANAPTPTDVLLESETETQLTDICDESWAVVLSHSLNGTLHLTEFRPALASGYLLRRRGPTDADGAFTMNLNLLYTQRPTSSYETLLRDIIAMYRDLASLARARGTRIVQSSTLPWHIAAALRAQEILSYVL